MYMELYSLQKLSALPTDELFPPQGGISQQQPTTAFVLALLSQSLGRKMKDKWPPLAGAG